MSLTDDRRVPRSSWRRGAEGPRSSKGESRVNCEVNLLPQRGLFPIIVDLWFCHRTVAPPKRGSCSEKLLSSGETFLGLGEEINFTKQSLSKSSGKHGPGTGDEPKGLPRVL